MNQPPSKPTPCVHQWTDHEGVLFNYCPWCGERLPKDNPKDDCVKGGCED